MHWLQHVSGAKEQLEKCIELEQVRYSNHFNILLGQHRLSYLRVVRQLKRSRRAERLFQGERRNPLLRLCGQQDGGQSRADFHRFV
jgi:hypothetical protein